MQDESNLNTGLASIPDVFLPEVAELGAQFIRGETQTGLQRW